MNHCDLRQLAGNKACITASRDDGNFFTRKLLSLDSRQNLPNQSTVTEDGTGTHCFNSRFTNGTMWLFQRQPREQRRPLIKKICHRFQSRRNYAANVPATAGNHVERHSCAEVYDDGRTTVKVGNGGSVRQAIRANRLWFGIIDCNTQPQFPIQPAHLRFVARSLRNRRVFCRHH